MESVNKYEQAYKLDSEKGVTAFLEDYPKIAEARFYANDLSISDMLLDFDFAIRNALTERQLQVIKLTYFNDMRQVDVARVLDLSQQTVQEHTAKAIKNIATYHMLLKQKDGE
jgi:DNA-directed RNA polymerase specialized sigma subunit